jgi:hypothetical protein
MARINSPQGRVKFPVPMRRELDSKLLYLALHSEPIAALGDPDEQNSAIRAQMGPTRISSRDAVLDFYLRRVSAAFVAVSLIRCCPIVSCRL